MVASVLASVSLGIGVWLSAVTSIDRNYLYRMMKKHGLAREE